MDRVERDALRSRGEAVPAVDDDENALAFVACGGPIIGHEIRVVDDRGRELGERHEGKLQFRGPSATQGFFRNEEKTSALYDGDWLNTGDLAYIVAGEVYLTGRSKDIIIRAGRNIHPHELEQALGNIEGVRKGCIAVFGSADPQSGTERIIVLAETLEKDDVRIAEIRRRIEETATDLLETPPDDVVLAPPQSVPKTSSGKIRRNAAKTIYEKGSISAGRRAIWMQLASMTLSGAFGQFRRTLSGLAGMAFSCYWWSIVTVGAALVWGTVLVLPGLGNRVSFLRMICRALMRLTGARLTVEGLENMPDGGAIIVANHSSYLDGLALLAALPEDIFFVAKRELGEQFLAGVLLRRIDTQFVERFDVSSSVEDSRKALESVKAGKKLVFFPEGTLTRMPGLLGFRLGAFSVAAEAGVKVLPVTIRGTRTVLRGDQWFARRGRLSVSIAPPVAPEGSDFTAAVKLRDAARAAILNRCGEPDLGEERVHFSADDGIQHLTEH